MRILITGATGLLGKEIGLELSKRGHELFVVSRNKKKALAGLPFPCQVIEGDLSQKILKNQNLKSIDAVLNLMGEGLAEKRWSSSQKAKIFESRILGTRNLVNSFEKAPSVFVSTSAVGIYGDAGDVALTEESKVGIGFLPDVCIGWEKEADDMALKGDVRIVKCRLAAVLSPKGGAFKKMYPLFKAGIGGRLASGKQWMSWIHIDDAVTLFVNVLENENYKGVLNFSSPEPLSNLDFSKALAEVFNRSLGPPVPGIVLKLLLGEMSQVVLDSQKVLPSKVLSLGFKFKFPSLKAALRDLCRGLGS